MTAAGRPEAKRIIVTGAGGAPALNFIKSLRLAGEPFHIIGVDCDEYSLTRAQTAERRLVPRASEEDYIPILNEVIRASEAELLFVQPDPEIAVVSGRNIHRLWTATVLYPHRSGSGSWSPDYCRDRGYSR